MYTYTITHAFMTMSCHNILPPNANFFFFQNYTLACVSKRLRRVQTSAYASYSTTDTEFTTEDGETLVYDDLVDRSISGTIDL